MAVLLSLATLALAAVACGSGGPDVIVAGVLPPGPEGGVYVALGDSIAAGNGASDPGRTDYVALLTDKVRSYLGPELRVQSLAVAGHTTQELIEQQLAPATVILRQDNTRLVTITISGNDLYQYSAAAPCLVDPADPACPLGDGLVGVEQRLDQILEALREAGPEAAIAIEVYPNLFSGTGHSFEPLAATAFDMLNDVIIEVAGRHEVLVADPRAAFEGRGDELTHIVDPTPDFHPNDAGHRLIADAFIEILELTGTPTAEE